MASSANLQDLLVNNQDTLSYQGEQIVLGSGPGQKSFIFSNDQGSLALVASITGNATLNLPSAGGGTIGQLTAIQAGTQTASTGAVVFSNSNNVTFGMSNSSVVTASASYSQSTAPSAISAGTTNATSGTIVFSNSNSVTFGLSGNTITASIAPGAAAGMGAVAAGTQTQTSGTVVFSNSNNVTFGMSNSSVVTASVGDSDMVLAAGTQTASTPATVVLSNSNGISFGMSNSSVVTASNDAARSISAGTTNATGSQIVFSNANGVSFGADGTSVITASVAAVQGIAAGTQTNTSGTVKFSNSNGISFGMSNSSVVTAIYGGMSFFHKGYPVTTFGSSNAVLSLDPLVIPYALTATEIDFLGHMSGASGSSGALTLSFGLYTLNGGFGGTLSLLTSASSQLSWTSGTNSSQSTAAVQYGGTSGTRYRIMTLNSWSLQPGLYVVGFYGNTSNAGSWTWFGERSGVSLVSEAFTSQTADVFPGFFTSSFTSAMPSSIAVTNVTYQRTGSNALLQPWFRMAGT